MRTPKFELMKLKRALNSQGISYTFSRYAKNSYKEPTDTVSSSVTLKGIYHQTSGYIGVGITEAARVYTKPQPMLLTTYEDAKSLYPEDKVLISGKTYKVTGVTDINNLGIIGDISLEVE